MTKSERLIKLIGLLKKHGAMSVQGMSRSCGVSSRTIYRDLNTLLRMNIPLYYADGYRLDNGRDFPLADLNRDELELVFHSLRTSRLGQFSFFQKKLGAIEQKIVDRVSGKFDGDHRSVILGAASRSTVETTPESGFLEAFALAVESRNKVTLRCRGTEGPRRSFIPVAIQLSDSGPQFVVVRDEQSEPTEFPVSEVIDLSISTDKFDRSFITARLAEMRL
jgi:predicted DNA-binding transcriptional regulator YafY